MLSYFNPLSGLTEVTTGLSLTLLRLSRWVGSFSSTIMLWQEELLAKVCRSIFCGLWSSEEFVGSVFVASSSLRFCSCFYLIWWPRDLLYPTCWYVWAFQFVYHLRSRFLPCLGRLQGWSSYFSGWWVPARSSISDINRKFHIGHLLCP